MASRGCSRLPPGGAGGPARPSASPGGARGAVGRCNVAIGFQRRFAAMLDVEPASVILDHVGLNHLTWERAAFVSDVDRLPELMDGHLAELAAEVDLPVEVVATLSCVP